MARIRSIHPGLFTDEAFASLSMPARVLLLGIWTESDDHGVFEWKPVTLKMRLMPVDAVSIPELLGELERAGVIKSFSSEKTYGLVRNFCRYQRPKKPKYVHPMPPELRTYAGLKPDGSLPVLHQSRTGSEKSSQREEEGGEGEEESGIKEKGESDSPSEANVPVQGKAVPIDETYVPSERAVEYAYSLGMRKADLNSELSKFIAKCMLNGTVSADPDMNFKIWCDRWLDYKREKNPNFKPEPEPPAAAGGLAMVGKVFVIRDTLGWHCWVDHLKRTQGRNWTLTIKHVDDGREQEGWWWPTEVPDGYDPVTGDRHHGLKDGEAAA